MARPNIHDPEFDEVREEPGFRARRSRAGYQLKAERLGVSVWEVAAGQAAYPYHLHLTEEELLIVLAGTPLLRTPEGTRRLEEGEIVSFPAGEGGAHQLINDTDSDVRFLAVSTNGEPDIVLYPDSNKLSAAERNPVGEGFKAYFRLGDAVDYWDGETPPETPG